MSIACPCFNPIALRKAKIVYNFGLSECNRVKAGNTIYIFIQAYYWEWKTHSVDPDKASHFLANWTNFIVGTVNIVKLHQCQLLSQQAHDIEMMSDWVWCDISYRINVNTRSFWGLPTGLIYIDTTFFAKKKYSTAVPKLSILQGKGLNKLISKK